MKPKQIKSKKLPQNVCAFYIKLYCNKIRSSKTKQNCNLIEATKSWLSLNESEKQQFHIKFNEYKEQYKANHFNQLKNAEPFMKKKIHINSNEDNSISSSLNNIKPEEDRGTEIHENNAVETEQREEIAEITNINLDNQESNIQIPEEQYQDEQWDSEIEPIDASSKSAHIPLIEPLPPTIKTGHELFYMLNSGGEPNITWESLTPIEKHQYTRAVSIMKKDYISKYREYLESLSSKELFDHYNKTI